MSYGELLIQKEWYNKCRDILQRDQYHCKSCGCLGYHNNSYYECDSAAELDSMLQGILIKGDTPSAFIKKICDGKKLKKINIDESDNEVLANRIIVDDIILTDLQMSYGDFGLYPRLLLTASKNTINESICKGGFLRIVNHDVSASQIINWHFESGGFYVFENSFFENYVVRIEKRWPNEVIISICFHSNGVCLQYAYNTAHFDSTGKYLGSLILPKGLNVHHKYYIAGKKPWEYDNDALITLCQDCHGLEHKTKQTPVYRDIHFNDISGYAQICDRCGGEGYLPQYKHVEGGICFKCYGEGVCVE